MSKFIISEHKIDKRRHIRIDKNQKEKKFSKIRSLTV